MSPFLPPFLPLWQGAWDAIWNRDKNGRQQPVPSGAKGGDDYDDFDKLMDEIFPDPNMSDFDKYGAGDYDVEDDSEDGCP